MHLIIGKAAVQTPTTDYSNAFAEIDAPDDVTATVTVRNRQGIDLERFEGPYESTGSGGWLIHTTSGDVTVTPQTGCGCGGTLVTPRGES